MSLICGSCRKLNPDDARVCAACGNSLQFARKQSSSVGYSMFGRVPHKEDITPLSEDRPTSTISASYGSAAEDMPNGYMSAHEAIKQQNATQGVPFNAKKARPKKPWKK